MTFLRNLYLKDMVPCTDDLGESPDVFTLIWRIHIYQIIPAYFSIIVGGMIPLYSCNPDVMYTVHDDGNYRIWASWIKFPWNLMYWASWNLIIVHVPLSFHMWLMIVSVSAPISPILHTVVCHFESHKNISTVSHYGTDVINRWRYYNC